MRRKLRALVRDIVLVLAFPAALAFLLAYGLWIKLNQRRSFQNWKRRRFAQVHPKRTKKGFFR